jgi:hypothetical protein
MIISDKKPHRVKTSRLAKIRWLLDHQDLWERKFQERGNTWEEEKKLMKLMIAEGLYSPTTQFGDINIYNLIRDAKNLGDQNDALV